MKNPRLEIRQLSNNQVGVFTLQEVPAGEIVIYGQIEAYLNQNKSHCCLAYFSQPQKPDKV